MKVEIIRTADRLQSLSSEWNDLLWKSPADTIFLTWEWIRSWVAAQELNHDLYVIVVRDEADRLVGVAPLYRQRFRLLRGICLYGLRVLGDRESGAEYANFLIREDQYAAVSGLVFRTLLVESKSWDFVWLPNLASWRTGVDCLLDAAELNGLAIRRRPRSFSAFMLPDNYETYLASMSSSRRQQLRRLERTTLNTSDFSVRRCTDLDNLDHDLLHLFDLHRKRWNAVGLPGSFIKRPNLQRFYELFVPIALERGWLRLYILEHKGQPVAIQIGYRYNDVFMQIQEGFDIINFANAGNALRIATIRALIDESATEYDFLGGYTDHKQRWQAIERLGVDAIITHAGLMSRLLHLAGIWPTGRYLCSAN